MTKNSAKWRMGITVLMLLAVLHPDPPQVAAQEANRSEANSLIARFQDNLERFAFMTCEYDNTQAKALTPADVLAGKWMPRQPGESLFPNTAQVRMVKDGKNVRYELIPDEESKKTRRDGHKSLKSDPNNTGLATGPAFAFASSTQLFNGADSIYFSPSDGPASGNNVNMRGKGIPSWAQERQQGGLLLNAIHGGGIITLAHLASASAKPVTLRTAPHRGVVCTWLTIHTPDGHSGAFALDPARGHLPLGIIWSDDKGTEVARVEVTEIKECSNARWFPMRIVTYMTQNRGFWIVTEYKVTKLDVDNRPSRESLMLNLPAGTSIMDMDRAEPGKVTPTVILKQNERIHPDEIPKLRELIYRKEAQPLADTAVHSPGIAWWKWAIAGAGLALVLAAAVWRVRSRRTSGATP